jgi:hypothetical protein
MAEKLPDKIDLTRCMAFKSKTDKQQCPCRHRAGSRFCGKHAQTKQEILANGTRRSANRTLTLQVPSTQLKRQQLTRNKKLLNSESINQTTNIATNQASNTLTKLKQITQQTLRKDPYLSKLTSQQINDNFLFYQLNKYLRTQNNNQTTNQFTNHNTNQRILKKQRLSQQRILATKTHINLTTEYKRKQLIHLLSLLARIDHLDPTHKKIIRLQRLIRKYKYKIRQWNRGKGSVYPLIQCTNKDDFASLDALDMIPPRLLFTYRDSDGFTYGFNLISLLELLANSEQPLNPYTRKPIGRDVITRANKYYRILDSWSKIDEPDVLAQQTSGQSALNNSGVAGFSGNTIARLTLKDRVKQRIQTVFQKINYLGYQTNTDWLMDKPTPILITFIKTMARNWSYQLGFTDTTKQSLLAPTDLQIFETLVNDAYRNPQLGHSSSFYLLNRILAVLEPLINNSADPNSAALLVLYSLYYIEPRRVSLANPWMS